MSSLEDMIDDMWNDAGMLAPAEADVFGLSFANVKKKVGQCLKKIRPPALEKTRPSGLKTLEKNYTTW